MRAAWSETLAPLLWAAVLAPFFLVGFIVGVVARFVVPAVIVAYRAASEGFATAWGVE